MLIKKILVFVIADLESLIFINGKWEPGPFLAYFMPVDYVMQGMIADTGGEWQLYKRHHTIAMIWDWVFHPFRHLEGGHDGMHHDRYGGAPEDTGSGSMLRRIIFLKVNMPGRIVRPADDFDINVARTPLFVVDVDVHTMVVESLLDLRRETGWGNVPTPMF